MASPATVAAAATGEPGQLEVASLGLVALAAPVVAVAPVVPGAQREVAEMVAKPATGELEATVVTARLRIEMGLLVGLAAQVETVASADTQATEMGTVVLPAMAEPQVTAAMDTTEMPAPLWLRTELMAEMAGVRARLALRAPLVSPPKVVGEERAARQVRRARLAMAAMVATAAKGFHRVPRASWEEMEARADPVEMPLVAAQATAETERRADPDTTELPAVARTDRTAAPVESADRAATLRQAERMATVVMAETQAPPATEVAG
jgi:hypothetical protein